MPVDGSVTEFETRVNPEEGQPPMWNRRRVSESDADARGGWPNGDQDTAGEQFDRLDYFDVPNVLHGG